MTTRLVQCVWSKPLLNKKTWRGLPWTHKGYSLMCGSTCFAIPSTGCSSNQPLLHIVSPAHNYLPALQEWSRIHANDFLESFDPLNMISTLSVVNSDGSIQSTWDLKPQWYNHPGSLDVCISHLSQEAAFLTQWGESHDLTKHPPWVTLEQDTPSVSEGEALTIEGCKPDFTKVDETVQQVLGEVSGDGESQFDAGIHEDHPRGLESSPLPFRKFYHLLSQGEGYANITLRDSNRYFVSPSNDDVNWVDFGMCGSPVLNHKGRCVGMLEGKTILTKKGREDGSGRHTLSIQELMLENSAAILDVQVLKSLSSSVSEGNISPYIPPPRSDDTRSSKAWVPTVKDKRRSL